MSEPSSSVGHAVAQRRADVQLELLLAVERDHHGQRQHRAGLARQRRVAPGVVPGDAGDEVLPRHAEGAGIVERAVDMGGARARRGGWRARRRRRAPGRRARGARGRRRCASAASAGRSTEIRWAQSGMHHQSRRRGCGARMSSPMASGATGSSAPTTTSVGAAIALMRSRRSMSAIASQQRA